MSQASDAEDAEGPTIEGTRCTAGPRDSSIQTRRKAHERMARSVVDRAAADEDATVFGFIPTPSQAAGKPGTGKTQGSKGDAIKPGSAITRLQQANPGSRDERP